MSPTALGGLEAGQGEVCAPPRLLWRTPGEPDVVLLEADQKEQLQRLARRLCQGWPGRCSRSYNVPHALVAFHGERVGVDIEGVEATELGFFEGIATPAERQRLTPPTEGFARDRFLIRLWSAKEAAAKALGDALAYDPRRLDSPLVWERTQTGLYLAGGLRARELELGPNLVGWVCWS